MIFAIASDFKNGGILMFKKIFPIVLIMTMISVIIVQAMEKEETKETNIDEDKIPGLSIGLKAPDFQLQTIDGELLKLSDFKGKKVIINFWATWCPPCKKEIPELESFHKASGDKVKILAVNMDSGSNVEKFAKEMKITYPILLDQKEKVSKMYKVISIPTTFFIDGDGIIRHKYLGPIPLAKMNEYTKDL